MMFSIPSSTRRSSTVPISLRPAPTQVRWAIAQMPRLALDAAHDLDGALARRAARAVGHRDERRRQLAELADRALERGHAGLGLGREELEREDAAVRVAEEIADAHGPTSTPAGARRRAGRNRRRCARGRAWALVAGGAVGQALQPLEREVGLDDDGLALALGRLEHDVVADLLDERAQAARAGAAADAEARDRVQRLVGEAQIDAVHLEQRLVLAHHRVGRRGHHQEQVVLRQRVELDAHGEAPQELGEQAVVEQLLLGDAAALGVRRRRPRRRAAAPKPTVLASSCEAQIGERAGGDEQDVLRVDDHEVVLVPVLGDVERHEALAPLEDLEQRSAARPRRRCRASRRRCARPGSGARSCRSRR